jgi:hypothetical protein
MFDLPFYITLVINWIPCRIDLIGSQWITPTPDSASNTANPKMSVMEGKVKKREGGLGCKGAWVLNSTSSNQQWALGCGKSASSFQSPASSHQLMAISRWNAGFG